MNDTLSRVIAVVGPLIVSIIILGMFGYAMVFPPSDTMVRLLENATLLVLGYWCGSSSGNIHHMLTNTTSEKPQ